MPALANCGSVGRREINTFVRWMSSFIGHLIWQGGRHCLTAGSRWAIPVASVFHIFDLLSYTEIHQINFWSHISDQRNSLVFPKSSFNLPHSINAIKYNFCKTYLLPIEAVRKPNFSRNFLIFYEQNFPKSVKKRCSRTASNVVRSFSSTQGIECWTTLKGQVTNF
jgi:hypothetical protein